MARTGSVVDGGHGCFLHARRARRAAAAPARAVRLGPMAAGRPALAPYVASLMAYDVDLGAPGVHRGLPTTSLTFVLPIGEPLDVGWRAARQPRRGAGRRSRGCTPRPAAIHHDGTPARASSSALTTAGARALLGVPAAELAGELLELDGRRARRCADLPERLRGVRPAEALAVVVAGAAAPALARHGAPGAAGRGRPGAGRADPRRRGCRRWPTRSATAGGGWHAWCGRRPGWRRRSTSGWAGSRRPARCSGRRPLAEVAAACGYADQAPPRPRLGRAGRLPADAPGCARSSHSSKTPRTPTRQAEAMTAAATSSSGTPCPSRRRRDDRVAERGRVHRARDLPRRGRPVGRRARRVAVARRRRDHVRLQRAGRRGRQRRRLRGVPRHRRPRRRLRPGGGGRRDGRSGRWSTRTTAAAAAASRIPRATTGRSGATSPRETRQPSARTAVAVRAVRGATQLDEDDREHMLERVAEMVARRHGGQRPRGRRLHLGDLHRDLRPGLGVPGVRRPPARLRRRAADLRARARDRAARCRGWCG